MEKIITENTDVSGKKLSRRTKWLVLEKQTPDDVMYRIVTQPIRKASIWAGVGKWLGITSGTTDAQLISTTAKTALSHGVGPERCRKRGDGWVPKANWTIYKPGISKRRAVDFESSIQVVRGTFSCTNVT